MAGTLIYCDGLGGHKRVCDFCEREKLYHIKTSCIVHLYINQIYIRYSSELKSTFKPIAATDIIAKK